MKTLTRAFLAALILAPALSQASTLTGTSTTLQFTPNDPPLTQTVGAGTDQDVGLFLFDFNAGPNGDRFSWTTAGVLGGSFGGNSGLTLSNLNFTDGSSLIGFDDVATTLTGLTVTVGAHSVTFQWNDVGFSPAGAILSGHFVTDAAAVPLPATLPLVLAGMGLAGMAARKRKAQS